MPLLKSRKSLPVVPLAHGRGSWFGPLDPFPEEKGVRRMRISAKRLFAAALALCAFTGARARADFVSWSYNWTPSSTAIYADNPTMGKIALSNEPGGTAIGDTYVVATNLKTAST